ncbi:AraC family transcriptional regulator [Caballeronia sp. LjRoot31]|uniref:AraC family transcriptional regulator n=1 Tax=Caballeronia sp. LjRoot31 TaxID=3342324 RepID=UPI003F4FE502
MTFTSNGRGACAVNPCRNCVDSRYLAARCARTNARVASPKGWTLEMLSSAVAMSRSAFSKRFKSLVGFAPLDYLLRWRMRIARDLLRHGSMVRPSPVKLDTHRRAPSDMRSSSFMAMGRNAIGKNRATRKLDYN